MQEEHERTMQQMQRQHRHQQSVLWQGQVERQWEEERARQQQQRKPQDHVLRPLPPSEAAAAATSREAGATGEKAATAVAKAAPTASRAACHSAGRSRRSRRGEPTCACLPRGPTRLVPFASAPLF